MEWSDVISIFKGIFKILFWIISKIVKWVVGLFFKIIYLKKSKSSRTKISVLIAKFENDDSKNGYRDLIAEQLAEHGFETIRLQEVIRLGDQPKTDEAILEAKKTALKLIKDKKSDLLIWGRVYQSEKGLPVFHLFFNVSEDDKNIRNVYPLEANFELPKELIDKIWSVISLIIDSQVSDSLNFDKYDGSSALNLIEKVDGLLKSEAWTKAGKETQLEILNNFSTALCIYGRQKSDEKMLSRSIAILEKNLEEIDGSNEFKFQPMKISLANYYLSLGMIDKKIDRLKYSEKLYREVLKGYREDQSRFIFALIKNNLSYVLLRLGEREKGLKNLNESIKEVEEALTILKKEKSPDEWMASKNNLGLALWALGERKPGIVDFQKAINVLKEALEFCNRRKKPLRWGIINNDLGLIQLELGIREEKLSELKKAVKSFKNALKERRKKEVPAGWAQSMGNLGSAYMEIGMQKNSKYFLKKSLRTFDKTLEVQTEEKLPLPWALIKINIGCAWHQLGIRESGIESLKKSIRSCEEALKVCSPDHSADHWIKAKSCLANATSVLGIKEKNLNDLKKALLIFNEILSVLDENESTFIYEKIKKDRDFLATRLKLKKLF